MSSYAFDAWYGSPEHAEYLEDLTERYYPTPDDLAELGRYHDERLKTLPEDPGPVETLADAAQVEVPW